MRLPKGEKKRIVASAGFKKWKSARLKTTHPPKVKPKDIVRAFQIDRSLKAKIRKPEYWKKIPQRADIGIDRGTETHSREKKRRYYSKVKR